MMYYFSFIYSTAPLAQRWAATPLLLTITTSVPLPILAIIIQIIVVMPYWTRVLLWKVTVRGISQKVSRAVMTTMEGACFFGIEMCLFFVCLLHDCFSSIQAYSLILTIVCQDCVQCIYWCRVFLLQYASFLTTFRILSPHTHTIDSASDSDSVNSADFFDTIARKPVTKVKMGESRKGTLNSSISGSKYGYVYSFFVFVWCTFVLLIA